MSEPLLSIGDVARATGVTEATLRVWETRHGFPQPHRLPSGHRRYSAAHVTAVQEVQRRRDAGVRLEVAIRQVLSEDPRSVRPSVFARIGDQHPSQPRRTLHKPTLMRISHAIEDEVVATGQDAHLFAAFQTAEHYEAAAERWTELARLAASAHVFADFGDPEGVPVHDRGGPGPVRVHLPDRAPMRREWVVICDAPDLTVAMLGWEAPGQSTLAERERTFEVMWTVDAEVVRDAARACAEAAAASGSTLAAELVTGPLAAPPADGPAPLAVSRLLLRILHQLDR